VKLPAKDRVFTEQKDVWKWVWLISLWLGS